MKTLVIGCTGTVGVQVVEGLVRQGVSVRCMTRSTEKMQNLPPGVEGQITDLDSPASLPAAFEDVDNLFLLVTVDPNETRRGLAAVEAAKADRVKKIVYLSVHMPEGSAVIPHFSSKLPIENAVKESGIAFTILRPNNFFQNDLSSRDMIMRYGIYPVPIGPIGLNRVDVRDVADCAVNALTRPGFEGETFPVHGPDTLTGADVAAIYTRHLGRIVGYVGDDLDAWAQRVRNIMPDWRARDLRVMYKFFQDHGMAATATELEKERQILGRKPRGFENFVRELVAEWKVSEARAA